MQSGLQIRFFWDDADVIELSLEVSNGEFTGVAKAYVGHTTLAEAASALAGFPASPSDRRTIELGTLDP
ncbi:MAG TPA: hypothetical protein VFU68_07695 [Terracidiphilus sp.]|nr:hypothetical protein [Terracidiphilus sp.]